MCVHPVLSRFFNFCFGAFIGSEDVPEFSDKATALVTLLESLGAPEVKNAFMAAEALNPGKVRGWWAELGFPSRLCAIVGLVSGSFVDARVNRLVVSSRPPLAQINEIVEAILQEFSE